MPNKWLQHVAAEWKKQKPKGKSYKETLVLAKKTYKKVASKTTKNKGKKTTEKKR